MIRRLCYELYKIDWKRNHKEFGYDEMLYVCYDEFFEHEYKDTEYMCSLLSDEDLIAMYYKDIGFRGN